MGEIALRNLTKEFGDVVAVDDVSLDIADGEFLVLVGPSGCGKSTTLRMIAGLESETAGDIHIAGDHMNYRVPQHRDIAMVFQDYALYPHMTVRGNLGFGLESEPGYTKAERHERVEEIAETLGIAELLDRKPGELSGGQQQRVALGRAIVRDPAVFLMDEPLSNLDAKLRAEMRTELQQLQDRFGVTTVYVTHNQTEAMTMGDRIAVMNDGELQQVGEPLELYHAPANLFVAGFIGEPMMNFTHGKVHDGTFVGDYVEYPFDDEIASAVEDGRRQADAAAVAGDGDAAGDSGDGDAAGVVLGVRPEDIHLEAGGSGLSRDPHAFSMAVGVVEPHGNQNVVHLRHPGDDEGDDLLKAVTAGTLLLEPGESVTATVDPNAVHVFDGATGRALHNRRRETAPEVVG